MPASSSITRNNDDFYIDVHAHVFPDFYEAAMKAAGVKDVDGWPDPKWSVEAMLQAADAHKIAAQVLSVSSPGIDFVDGKTAADLARRLNEYMVGMVKEHAPRFGSLAVLPLPDIEATLAEIALLPGHARHGRGRPSQQLPRSLPRRPEARPDL